MELTARLLVFAAVGSFLQHSAQAAPIPTVDVARVAAEAEIIVTGRSLGTVSTNSPSGVEVVRLQVGRMLKGTLTGSPRVVFIEYKPASRLVRLWSGAYGMFFLARASDGNLGFVDDDCPSVVASPVASSPPDRAQGGQEVMSRVAYELASVYALPGEEAGSVRSGVARDMRLTGVAARNQDAAGQMELRAPSGDMLAEGTYREATLALRTVPSSVRSDALRWSLTKVSNGPGSIWATGELLESGDMTRLPSVVGYLLNPKNDESGTDEFLFEVVDAIRASEEQLPALLPLLKADDPSVRRTGAYAVARVNSMAIVGPLRPLVADPDRETRRSAVRGICRELRRCDGLSTFDLAEPGGQGTMEAIIRAGYGIP